LEPLKDSVIDFDWERPPKEIEEISDVPALEEGIIVLKDPAEQQAARMAAKKAVREAFAKAREAHTVADTLAQEFVDKYDFSENESVFTGYEDSSEDEEVV
jgi:DNA helicase TIP49 (TBP-interacting protein)